MSAIATTAGLVLEKVFEEGLGRALHALLHERMRDGQARLARQIAKRKPWLIAEDDAAMAMLTYRRAVSEGVARLNLELLAQMLVSGAAEPGFTADGFRRQAEMVSNLSYEEIVILAFASRVQPALDAQPKLTLAEALADELAGRGRPFEDQEDIFAALTALQRTGFVRYWSPYGVPAGYKTTKAYEALLRLIDIEDAMREAASEG